MLSIWIKPFSAFLKYLLIKTAKWAHCRRVNFQFSVIFYQITVFLEVKLIKCKQYASKTYPVQSARVKILRITSGDKIHYAAFNISNLYCVGCGHCLHWVTKSISLGQILDLLNAKALKSKCMVISLCGGCDIYYKWSLSSNFMSLYLCTYKNATSYIKLSWFLRNSTLGSNLLA